MLSSRLLPSFSISLQCSFWPTQLSPRFNTYTDTHATFPKIILHYSTQLFQHLLIFSLTRKQNIWSHDFFLPSNFLNFFYVKQSTYPEAYRVLTYPITKTRSSLFRKPWFSHTFSFESIKTTENLYKNYGFSINWSRTSLQSKFTVLLLSTHNLLFSTRKREMYELRKNSLVFN